MNNLHFIHQLLFCLIILLPVLALIKTVLQAKYRRNVKYRMFHIGDVLSISSGCLVSERMMTGIYDILNYMTNNNLFTHALPRAAGECTPSLLYNYPFLDCQDIKFRIERLCRLLETNSGKSESNLLLKGWLCKLTADYPTYLEVIPIKSFIGKNPIQELEEIINGQA